jgi:hypothetical protein
MHRLAIGLALLLALAIIAIGTQYLLNPLAATRSFGLPLPEHGANTAWWLRLKGVRDIVAGLAVLAFMAWGDPRGIGLILLVEAITPLGDMLLILAAQGSTKSAFGMHAPTAVLMVLTAVPLLIGGTEMIHTISIWLLVAGFFGAGVFNALGTPATQNDFARWGYPRWWGRVTGALEIISAALLAFPASRMIGLALGALIIAAGVLTVLRHRDYKHLVPLAVFATAIALAKL